MTGLSDTPDDVLVSWAVGYVAQGRRCLEEMSSRTGVATYADAARAVSVAIDGLLAELDADGRRLPEPCPPR